MTSARQSLHQIKRTFLDSLYRLIAKSNFLVRLAVSLNFHSRKIFKYHIMDGSAINDNGESLLAKTVISQVSSFIDVGANEGDWAEIFLLEPKLGIQGLLYEPNTFAYEKLKNRFYHLEGIVIENKALGEFVDEKVFYESKKASNLSSLVSKTYRDAVERIVKITTLDIECEKYGFTNIDFLKIDTEGYDLYVLKGAKKLLSQQSIGIIQFEYNRSWVDSSSTLKYAINFLESFGYKVFLLKADGLYEFQYGCYGEYYEYSNFVALAPQFDWLEKELYQGVI
jgi:FkbM family methyltransferase